MPEHDETTQILEFFVRESDFSRKTPPKCTAIWSTGRPCQNYAVVRLDVGSRCAQHCSKDVRSVVAARKAQAEAQERASFNAWADQVEKRIRSFYEKAQPYRRVPPPESIAAGLLRDIQDERCFMCLCMGSMPERTVHLVEDHSHETGMVRALLCQSCNSLEGRSNQRIWDVYRKYAPANGWYYRYHGWNAQWHPGDPDPLPNRMRMEIDWHELLKDPRFYVHTYKKLITSLPDTFIPLTCDRRFESGKPLLLPGERYARPDELKGYGDWPIVSDNNWEMADN